jgi:hypothetical protein
MIKSDYFSARIDIHRREKNHPRSPQKSEPKSLIAAFLGRDSIKTVNTRPRRHELNITYTILRLLREWGISY